MGRSRRPQNVLRILTDSLKRSAQIKRGDVGLPINFPEKLTGK
jgi:hypothetical protein